MDEMIKYIFSTTQRNEDGINSINKVLQRQKKLNKKLTVLSLGLITYAFVTMRQREDDKQTLKQQQLEIDDLKRKMLMTDLRFKKFDSLKGEDKM